MGWFILIAIMMWILQCLLGLWQFKKFNATFKTLRTKGRVAIGRSKGKLRAGVVLLLCIDSECKIIQGKKLQGLTIFATLKDFTPLNGKILTEITQDDCKEFDPNLKNAVLNAVNNYQTFEQQKNDPRAVRINNSTPENA